MKKIFSNRKCLKIALIFLLPLNLFSQSIITYKDLTPLLNLVHNCECCNTCGVHTNEDLLVKQILALNWNLSDSKTYDTLYEQLKDEIIDYRYNLIIAKAASDIVHKDNNIDKNIPYYYKSLFLRLAIENSNNLFVSHSDSLKYQYTEDYYLSTMYDYTFPTIDAANDFAAQNVKYAKDLLNGFRFKLKKEKRSNLYYIIADALKNTSDFTEENKESYSEVFKYLQLAVKEDPNNWKAYFKRAQLDKIILKNYQQAINDYIHVLNIFENENKNYFLNHKKWLLQNKKSSSENKLSYMRPTFEDILNIAECYFYLEDHKNLLFWANKGMKSIKEYHDNLRNSEYASEYIGQFYYFRAISYFEMKQNKIACEELQKALNYGYDIDICNKLQIKMSCIKTFNEAYSSKVNSVPMIKMGGVYEIPILINGVLKLNFIFDAGAADVSISSDVALTLIRTGTVKNEDFIGTETYKFADGSTAKSKVFLIKEIQIGDKKVFNIKTSISNSLTAPLLLGQSVLNKFGKVTIDYKKEIIVFED